MKGWHSSADIVVRRGLAPDQPDTLPTIRLTEPWPCVVRLVTNRTLEISLSPSCSADIFPLLVSGLGLGLVLHSRGQAVLHGSAVSIDGKGIGILGSSGTGKSTITAALDQRGHAHVSDGKCAVEFIGNRPFLKPGPPVRRLRLDSLPLFGEDPDLLDSLAGIPDKRLVPAIRRHTNAAIPLTHLFVMTVDSTIKEPRFTQPSHAQAAWDIIHNYYLSPYLAEREARSILSRCGVIASSVVVARLVRPSGLEYLDSILHSIEEYIYRT